MRPGVDSRSTKVPTLTGERATQRRAVGVGGEHDSAGDRRAVGQHDRSENGLRRKRHRSRQQDCYKGTEHSHQGAIAWTWIPENTIESWPS